MLKKLFTSSLFLMATLPAVGSISRVRAQAPAAETVVVFPFDNLSNHPEYNWIGESFSDSLSGLLNKPGLMVVTSDERAVEVQRLHLPLNVLPSRATEIKIGRELKASVIVIGNFNVTLPTTTADKPNPSAETK